MSSPSAVPVLIHKITNESFIETPDVVAVEEPMEIRLGFGPSDQRERKSLAVTMRTPGNDLELAFGFLITEGILSSMDQVMHVDHCTDDDGERTENIVRVELSPTIKLDWNKFERHFYTNSSCGICGKASIESLEGMCPAPVQSNLKLSISTIHSLGEKMRETQAVFEHTGGLHAAALFNNDGELIYLREDIGRHNAVDKIVGTATFKNQTPLNQHILMLSGRSCFELIQKAVVAGIPVIVSVGAPSSLAVETAKEFGITLIGFSKNNIFNIYSHANRIL